LRCAYPVSELKLKQLKAFAAELGVKTPAGDKREIATWVNAIVAHQSSQLQKIDSPKSEDDVNFIKNAASVLIATTEG
jgi:hypothetical protein